MKHSRSNPLRCALVAGALFMMPFLSAYSSDFPGGDPPVIPLPQEVSLGEGGFAVVAGHLIEAPPELRNEAEHLAAILAPALGAEPVRREGVDAGEGEGVIRLEIDEGLLEEFGGEGYELRVDAEEGVWVRGAAAAGVFYGIQTLRQLLPPEIAAAEPPGDVEWVLPVVEIRDRPRFSWRAFMLDESRYFKGGDEVRRLLDQMAALKMNVFHWHLTDDQGWRIEILKYPRLTEVGAWRSDSQIGGWNSEQYSGEPHGGFYAQDEIREIVAYAAARHIVIVPEIGMPGHASAAVAAYPWLGTKEEEIEVPGRFGKHEPTFNPASKRVYEAIGHIFDEVAELFPGPVIHLGGDEVKFNHWRESEEVAALMEREGLETMADVQIYFTNRVAAMIEERGRRAMGWNEILGGDLHGFLQDGQTASAATLAPGTVVHFWKGGTNEARRAIDGGYSVVNSNHSDTYLDYGYGRISLERAYSFDPMFQGLSPSEQERILGLGTQMWGEWIPTVERMEYQVYPRIAAYAEVGWTEPGRKNFASFRERLAAKAARWEILGIGYARDQATAYQRGDFFNFVEIDEWTPEQVGAEWGEVEFSTGGRLSGAGIWEVAFVYTHGAHALEIESLALLEDGREVARDERRAFSGNRMNDVVFRLALETHNPDVEYILRARIRGSEGTDSHGELRMQGPL